jgi:ABC-2 type transport system ATP-binding protein
LYGKLSVAENLRLFARLEASPTSIRLVARGCSTRPASADRADEQVVRLSGGNQQAVNVAIGLLAAPPVLLLDEPSASLDPRQRERLWGFHRGARRSVGTASSIRRTWCPRPSATRAASWCWPTASGSSGDAAELERACRVERRNGCNGDFETAFVSFLRQRGHGVTMMHALRWLLLKDLAHPAAIAADGGRADRLPGGGRAADRFALSRGRRSRRSRC